MTFVNQGARVRVCVDDARALAGVEHALPVGSRIEASSSPDVLFSLSLADDLAASDARYRLTRNSRHLESSHDLGRLLQRLESELDFTVATHARSSLFVHAGVVGWRGRAILVPGRSMSGKTSLVMALLRAGAEYYSDEYAVIDATGRIHPYPRRLGVRAPGGGSDRIAPESVGGRVGSRPLRAGLVVSTHYAEGERFEPVDRGATRGLMILIGNTVLVRERPRFALDILMPVARDAGILEGVRGEADEAAAWLLRHLDAATSEE